MKGKLIVFAICAVGAGIMGVLIVAAIAGGIRPEEAAPAGFVMTVAYGFLCVFIGVTLGKEDR